MALADLTELRGLLGALGLSDRATGVETAAARRIDRARRIAGEDDALAVLLHIRIRNRNCGEQGLRVRVVRLGVQALPIGELDHLAEVHDGHAVGDVLHDGQVVGDEQISGSVLLLQVLQQVQDLSLDGNVQGGNRLVADDELRAQDERASDADALTLTAGELVRVAVDVLGIEADHVKQLANALDTLLGSADAVNDHRLGDDLTDGHTGVQGCIGILEDELHLSAHGLELLLVHLGDVATLEVNLAGGRRIEVHDGATGGGLTATGLTDQAERLASTNLEGKVVDSGDDLLGELTTLSLIHI